MALSRAARSIRTAWCCWLPDVRPYAASSYRASASAFQPVVPPIARNHAPGLRKRLWRPSTPPSSPNPTASSEHNRLRGRGIEDEQHHPARAHRVVYNPLYFVRSNSHRRTDLPLQNKCLGDSPVSPIPQVEFGVLPPPASPALIVHFSLPPRPHLRNHAPEPRLSNGPDPDSEVACRLSRRRRRARGPGHDLRILGPLSTTYSCWGRQSATTPKSSYIPILPATVSSHPHSFIASRIRLLAYILTLSRDPHSPFAISLFPIPNAARSLHRQVCYFCLCPAGGGWLAAQPNNATQPVGVFPRLSTLAPDANAIRFELIDFLRALAIPAPSRARCSWRSRTTTRLTRMARARASTRSRRRYGGAALQASRWCRSRCSVVGRRERQEQIRKRFEGIKNRREYEAMWKVWLGTGPDPGTPVAIRGKYGCRGTHYGYGPGPDTAQYGLSATAIRSPMAGATALFWPSTVPRRVVGCDIPSAEPGIAPLSANTRTTGPETRIRPQQMNLDITLCGLWARAGVPANYAETTVGPACVFLAFVVVRHLDVFTGAKKHYIFFRLMRVYWREFSILAILMVLRSLTAYSGPFAMNKLLQYVETRDDIAAHVVRPWVWVVLIGLGPLLGSLIWQLYIFINTRTLVRTEAIITQLVFAQSLRIRMKADVSEKKKGEEATAPATPAGVQTPTEAESTTVQPRSASVKSGTESVKKGERKAEEATREKSVAMVGRINNLVTTDLDNIVDSREFLDLLVYTPLQLSIGIYFLYVLLGWSVWVGVASIVVLAPVPGYMAKLVGKVQKERLKYTDERVSSASEAVNDLRMVRLSSSVSTSSSLMVSAGQVIRLGRKDAKRDEELRYIWKRCLLELASALVKHVTFSSSKAPVSNAPLQLPHPYLDNGFNPRHIVSPLHFGVVLNLLQCAGYAPAAAADRVESVLQHDNLRLYQG
uniref:Multidrug resistance-associated ABC transporter protein n=1 Tax=Mycena chlorophos TaxID=658473 RepID=A0ABQ0LPL2_MYCCL|nr:multidrug resistance-associated ABC transporter protein [Mycena chlorophos]